MCSGAIVSSKNVLTTASFVNGLSPADVEVYVGFVTCYANGFTFNVANILKHPNFDSNSYESDIAILTLQITIPFSNIFRKFHVTRLSSDDRKRKKFVFILFFACA